MSAPRDYQRYPYGTIHGPSPAGVKYDDGKLRFDLIPPLAMAEFARVYTIGAKKYEDRNWEKGLKWGRVFRALIAHAFKWWAGEKRDPDGQHPLASVMWCAATLMQYEHTHRELDDRSTHLAHRPGDIDYIFRPERVPHDPFEVTRKENKAISKDTDKRLAKERVDDEVRVRWRESAR